jgi:asparagine synthase (glutamine-hydrolysing)
MFAFALWDRRNRCLLLARDRFGIKPLYFAQTSESLYFASEQKAILSTGMISPAPSPRGVHDLLTFGFVVAPATMLEGMHQLEPGTWLRFQEGRRETGRYWDPTFSRDRGWERRPEREWIEAFRDKLEETVRIHLRSDVPVGAWLSPGIDSSTIVALMDREHDEPIHTTTLSFDQPGYDELRGQRTLLDDPVRNLTRHVATFRLADFDEYVRSIWFGEDPTATGIEVPRGVLGRETSSDVKVVLTGEGADEVLAGYPRFRLDRLTKPFALLPVELRRVALLGNALPRRFRRLSRLWTAPHATRMVRYASTLGGPAPNVLEDMLSPQFKQTLRREERDWDLDLPKGFDHWPALSQLQYYEIRVRLPAFVNHTLDRGTMAHSVEARVPFLDHELFELTARMPPRLKLRRLREKYILRGAVEDLLPAEIAGRRKRGMVSPIDQWLRKPLAEPMASLLGTSEIRRSGYFNADVVHRTLGEHRRGTWNRSTELMAVLAMQVWDALFIRESIDPRDWGG